jgi:mannose-1-phosphate guanylyltransferase
MTNVILCGGTGTRLWPISRENYPKQFLQIFENESIFQRTIKRNKDIVDKFLIVSNENQYFTALDQIQELNLNDRFLPSIIEPFGKNTAASIAFAAFSLNKDDIMFITPADHMVENDKIYEKAISLAKEYAQKDYIVTFGIDPTFEATGYGYIEAKLKIQNGEFRMENSEVFDVKKFHEKPDLKTAKEYIEINSQLSTLNSQFLWNSGMFIVKAEVYLNELKKYAPDIYESTKKAFDNSPKNDFIRINPTYMSNIPENSIDYAIMENTKIAKVVKSEFKWKDVGDFDSLYEVLPKDENKNTITKELYQINSKNNLIFGKYKAFALNNIENMIIVNTPTALLVAKRGEGQEIKDLVNIIKKENPELVKFGRTVYRPWGKYTNLEESDNFKVKILTVNPGKRLSLQKHLHRSEHWTVVKGTALIRNGDKEFLLRPNESTYIPIGVVHRISNLGKIPVEIVEVQVGEYLGEDDIIRLEDDYGRK